MSAGQQLSLLDVGAPSAANGAAPTTGSRGQSAGFPVDLPMPLLAPLLAPVAPRELRLRQRRAARPAAAATSAAGETPVGQVPSGRRAGEPRRIRLAGEPVDYLLRRARRRSIGFTIGRAGLCVAAPRWVPLAAVEQALLAKSAWIGDKLAQQRERARAVDATRIEWRDGALLPFLGAQVPIRHDATAVGVQLRDGRGGHGVADHESAGLRLHVGLPDHAHPAQLRDAVHGWLQRQAMHIFEQRIEHWAPRLGVRVSRLSLSSAATRWGSARADGSVRLHWRLVHFGLPVLDYVVVHELAHLRVMNHSAAFWAVVESVLPDYRQRRGALRHGIVPDPG